MKRSKAKNSMGCTDLQNEEQRTAHGRRMNADVRADHRLSSQRDAERGGLRAQGNTARTQPAARMIPRLWIVPS